LTNFFSSFIITIKEVYTQPHDHIDLQEINKEEPTVSIDAICKELAIEHVIVAILLLAALYTSIIIINNFG